jgi:hypothetical protein
MAALVYALCVLASTICAALLLRHYQTQRSRLLLWSAAGFVLLALNNLFVFFDIVLFPTTDFAPMRSIASLAAVMTLLYGFIWELD